MSHVSTTATTTTPPVMVVSSGLSSVSSVAMAPPLTGLPATMGQHEVVQPPPLIPRGSGGVVGLAFVPQQQPPSLMPILAYANYAMGSPQVGFFFTVEPPTILYIICLVSILVPALYFQVPSWMLYSPVGAQPLGFAPLQPFGVYPLQAYVQPGDGHWSTPGMHRVAAPSTTLSRGSLLLLSWLSPNHPSIWGHTALGAEERVTQSLCLLYMMGRGLLFQFWCHHMTPGDSSVVVGYQVDEFTHTWSAQQFVAHSHIYPGFTGKVSSLTHFPLKPGCEDFAFLDQAVADFEQGLDSILIDSLDTLELDTSLGEPDVITSSFSSGFLTLNSANRKADQSLSDFQTAVGAAAHATLDTEHLISCLLGCPC